ncbi:hypothetical protein MPSEU_000856900 [Mayamaea pseudoterrestris]|nr:hypothetical protein MPSEU_000856900 [Mayamaea pseudoterrestris]
MASLIFFTEERNMHHAILIRIEHGAAAAAPLYQQLLLQSSNHSATTMSDCTTASHLAASPLAHKKLLETTCNNFDRAIELRKLLKDCHYTTRNIHDQLQVPTELGASTCPIYVTPVAAGTVSSLPWVDGMPLALECLIALFLVGLAVPKSTLEKALSPAMLAFLLDMALVAASDVMPNTIFGLVQIFPLDLGKEKLYLVTDWHPRVLSLTGLDNEQDAVMYIGPDSLALVQHYLMDDKTKHDGNDAANSLLDVCTGSGIQALVALMRGKCRRAVCLDMNPRCLKFAKFNAALNGLDGRVEYVCGDLISGQGYAWNQTDDATIDSSCRRPLISLLDQHSFDIMTANPPFLPVPPELSARRHGLFSAGGSDGEVVLASIIELASKVLSDMGSLAVVSEFFLTKADSADLLLRRIQGWFGNTLQPNILLFTNEFPINAATYAERRSDSVDERNVWLGHLQSQNISYASPGLLYICRREPSVKAQRKTKHVLVPKASKGGSLWSPSNWEAVDFTRKCWHQILSE